MYRDLPLRNRAQGILGGDTLALFSLPPPEGRRKCAEVEMGVCPLARI